MAKTWIKRWGYLLMTSGRPGIWRLKAGGFLIEGRVAEPRTKKRQWVSKSLPSASLTEAQRERDKMLALAREEASGSRAQTTTFSAFATSLYARKVTSNELGSAKSRERWDDTLRKHLVPAFGIFRVDELRRSDVETWKAAQSQLVAAGKYKPETVNGWLRILLTIMRAAVAEYELERDPTRGVSPLDTTDHPTYTEENPNALTVSQTGAFLAKLRELYPQHYAIALLGFATGLRPSSLRPLRCRGPRADVLWREDAILVRRSNALGDEVRDTTKQKRRYRIHLPPDVMGVLAGQVMLVGAPRLSERWGKPPLWWRPKMATSELLFPGNDGGMRARSILDKPFADVSQKIGLAFDLTPRGMRRTFNDLARAAEVHDVVTRSISGHLTDDMQRHYSTAQADEQRSGISRVLAVVREASAAPGLAGQMAGKETDR